jgi:hypothetical protein
MQRKPNPKKLQAEVDRFNAAHPVGSNVRAWTGLMGEGPGQVGHVREPAYVLGGHTAVVHLTGVRGCVALSHTAPA